MTIITEDITDVTGAGDDRPVIFSVEKPRSKSGGTGIITRERVICRPVDGLLVTPHLDPGPAKVTVGGKTYKINIPYSASRLWPLIEEYEPAEPLVVSQVRVYAEGAAGDAAWAADSADWADESRLAAEGSAVTASGSAWVATSKATEAEAARAEAFLHRQAAALSESNALAYRNTANDAAATAIEKAGEASDSADDASTKATEAEAARDEAVLAREGAELARDQTAEGAVPDGGVTRPKLSAALQSSIDKADESQNAVQVQAIALAAATAKIADIIGDSPEALDTVYELAAAIGNDPNFRDTVLNAIGLRALLTDPRFTDARTPTAHDHSAGDIQSGMLPVARGGTGRGDLVDGSYMRGAGGGAIQMRTPAQVLTDIGAAGVTTTAEAAASADATITATSPTDVPGMTVTKASTGTTAKYEVEVSLDAAHTGGNGHLIAELWIDGAARSGQMVILAGTYLRAPFYKKWRITGLSAASHTYKVRAYRISGTGDATIAGTHSVIAVTGP